MEYQKIRFNDHSYYVCIYGPAQDQLFVIDSSDLKKILNMRKTWEDHKTKISSTRIRSNGYTFRYYIDKIIMEKYLDEYNERDDGNKYIVKHINGDRRDNRKENLVIVNLNVSIEMINKDIDKKIPKNLKSNDIPRYISYNTSNNNFVINIKHDGIKYNIQSISSKDLSINGKLEHAKMKLIEFASEHPDITQEKELLNNYSKTQIRLMKEFNKIIELTDFDCIEENLIEIPKIKTIKVNLDYLSKKDRDILTNTKETAGTGRRCTTELPDGCKTRVKDIPRHCTYVKAKGGRSDYFYIRGHPNQTDKRDIRTNGSTKMTTDEKFEQLLQLLRDLNRKVIDI